MILSFLATIVMFTGFRGLSNSNFGKKLFGSISRGIDNFFGCSNQDNNLLSYENFKQREYLFPSEKQFSNSLKEAIEIEYTEIKSNSDIEKIDHFEKGNNLAENGEYEMAVKEFESHIKIFPEQVGAYIQLAFCYRYMGNLDKAISNVQNALSIKNNISNGYSMLGKLYNETGNHIKAIEALEKGVAQNPASTSYYELSKAYFNKGNSSDKVINYCDISLEKDLNNFEAIILKSTVFIEEGEMKKAIDLLNVALKNKNINDKVLYSILLMLCSVYILEGEYEKAVKECEKALALDKTLPAAHFYRCICHLAKGEFEAAEKIIMEIHYKNELSYICSGYIKIGTGNPEGAIVDFKEAEKINFKNPEIYNGLHIAYKMLNQSGAAELNLEKALRYKIKGQKFLPIKGVEISDIPKTYNEKYEIVNYRYSAGTKFVIHTAIYSDNQKVAIKELNDYFASQQLFVNLFKKEIDIVKGLKHPNVIDIIDHGINKYNERYYIVMPLMKYNLKDYIERVDVSEKEIVKITLQILEGLKYCHNYILSDEKGCIVHRELKPTEVLIDYDGTVKISDFANAKATATFTSQSGASINRADLDAIYFIAPERLQGKKADIRADIYSVGALMYYMARGAYPFQTETKENNLQRILRIMKEPVDITEENTELGRGLIDIIIKAMDKNRDNRYQNDEEIINAVKQLNI